jgi:hypothetical protein
MELVPILETYGLPGLLIAVLLTAVRSLWDRVNTIQDARIAEMRHSADRSEILVREIKNTLDATLAALKEVR